MLGAREEARPQGSGEVSLHSDTRMLSLGVVVTLGAGAIVTLSAMQQDIVRPSVIEPAAPAPGGALPALSYLELQNTRRGPNGWMYRSVSTDLADRLPAAEEGSNESDEDRAAALDRRTQLRAFDGAPPAVPHDVTQQTMDCAGCHLTGAVIAGKTAPQMSHRIYPSCTQCHVSLRDPRPVDEPFPDPENSFSGLRAQLRGERAWPGAPPTIPHTTQLRSECNTCHGPAGKVGLRTPHPSRVSCEQCHAASAMLDQRPPWIRDEDLTHE